MRWTRQRDTLLVARAMSLAEIAELLGCDEAACLARAEDLGVDLTPPEESVAGLRLTLHPELHAELAAAAEQAGDTLGAFCRRMLRDGFRAYVPDERLPELPGGEIDQDMRDYRSREAMPLDVAEKVARRVLVQLVRGSIEHARGSLEDGWQAHVGENAPLPTGEALLEEPLSRVLSDLRSLNTLERQGILTIGRFLDCGDEDFLSMVNIGHSTLLRLRNLAVMLRQRIGAKEVA